MAIEKVVRVFHSFEEAEQADAEADSLLTPEERIQIAIELRDRRHPDAAEQRLARVCKITQLEKS
jgi:hypothetical protein